MNIEVDITISAAKEQVWAAITDIDHCADWISGIIEVEVLNKPENGVVGLKWKETREMFGKEAVETMWITDAIENEYYQTRAESHGAVYISKLAISQNGNEVVLSMSFSSQAQSMFAKIMAACMGVFMKGSMKKLVAQDLEDIKKHVENN